MGLLVTWVKWKLVLVYLEIMLISTHDVCTVCAERTIGSKIISVHLEILLILAQDRCKVCAEHTIGLKIILTHPMVLQGDVGQLKTHFRLFGDTVNLGTR
jgi:hypothetical protein